ncbi:hypothetical protein Dxin01_01596 [Deinococcus xinjiangensis]|uniref:Transglutaminase-like domain-containing protein n=1 Tax=Deinococcus xinjiangensis TaxID=457454 RepID=A0ABP9V9C0_9DEIO
MPLTPSPNLLTPSPTLRSPRLRPTRLGLTFLALTVATLIGCINYGLSLGYGLTFLLGGVWIVTAAQANRAARTLSASVLPPTQATAGQDARFTVQVSQTGPAGNVRLEAQASQLGRSQIGHSQSISSMAFLGAGQTMSLPLTVAAPLRGRLELGEVRLIAVDGLGLWHAAYALQGTSEVWVAPKPEADAPAPPTLHAAGGSDTGRRAAGHDEFAGVRAYAAGDAPRLISWKHAARTGDLMTREFDAPAGEALNLTWAATASAGQTEARLSRLAAWVAQASEHGLPFAFELQGTVLPPAHSENQRQAALNALAQFTPLPEAQPQGAAKPTPRPLPLAPLRFSLLALAFSMLPALAHFPVWISGMVAALLGYAALQADPQRKLAPISPLVLLLLAVASGAGLIAQYGTLLGQEAGTALLAVLLALKASETRTVRDAKLLSLLGLFMTSTHYFASQGPLTALHSVAATWLLLAALAGWVNGRGGTQTGRELLRPISRVMLLAAPLALLLFAFFPRPDGPLWQLPLQGGNQTGLADEISAGEFGNLAQSRAVAFRADFGGGKVPPPAERYWRGPLYEAYDGRKWTQVRARFAAPTVETLQDAPLYRYALTLEPSGKPWLLALDTPTQLPQNAVLTGGFQAATFRPASLRTRYEFQSQAARLGREESVERLNFDLLLPEGQSPRARALAEGWRTLAPAQRVQAALDYLAQGGFSYTLSPPTLSEENRVDDFLFRSKQGFCEHYSSAFAFLMRAAGLPARIVGGYQGGEVNPDGGYLIVRQQDAHAWDEVWLEGRGWVRVDPTAVVAPARISTNLGTALTQPNATAPKALSNVERLRLRLDTFQNAWNNWVVSYNGDQQRTLLSRLGVGGVGSVPYLLGLAGVVALLLLPMLALVRRAARPRDPALAALHDLSERLGLPRSAGETATAYADRAAREYPQQAALLHEIAALFNTLRYGPPAQSAATLQHLRDKLRQVRQK